MLHFTQLGETLRKFGLMDSTGLITKPSNVINSDKCPNMINGVWNGNGGKLIGGSVESVKTIIGEDHAEDASLMSKCGMDVHKNNPQFNCARKNLDPGLFPTKSTKLDDCWVSITKKGTQTKERFIDFSKWIIQVV